MKKKHVLSVIVCASLLQLNAQTPWNTATAGQISYTGGNVGINTSSPLTNLHISSNEDAITWPLILNNTRNSSTISGYGVGLQLKHSNNSEGFKWGGIATVQESTWANASGLALFANEKEHMRINSSGYVGIGVTNPLQQLHVKAPASTIQLRLERESSGITDLGSDGSGLHFWVGGYDNFGSSELFIGTDGKVGIGTNSPSQKLDVSGNIKFGKSHVTDFNFLSDGHGGAHAMLFNAYYGTGPNSNGWIATETKYSNGAGAYGGGAGAVVFYGNGGTMDFMISPIFNGAGQNIDWGAPKMRILRTGNVGIGTMSPDAKLTVKGTIHSEEVKVDLSVPGPDYVFEEDYDLRSLEETAAYIEAHKHLPEVPSASEMEENGIQLGEMNMLLLKKIEELTLYQIELQKQVKNLIEENKRQEAEIKKLKSE